MTKAATFWLLSLVAFLSGFAAWTVFKRAPQPPASVRLIRSERDQDYPGRSDEWIHDFVLTERSGREFDSKSELGGKVWVASVFFASCTASCRTQNGILSELSERYRDRGLHCLSITCDPRNDTPERLREYARSFKAAPDRWLFLTGDIRYIRRIAAERFQIAADDHGDGDKPFHADQFTVVDKWGNVRGAFFWARPEARLEMKALIEKLLEETEPPPPEPPTRVPVPGEEDVDT